MPCLALHSLDAGCVCPPLGSFYLFCTFFIIKIKHIELYCVLSHYLPQNQTERSNKNESSTSNLFMTIAALHEDVKCIATSLWKSIYFLPCLSIALPFIKCTAKQMSYEYGFN